MNNIAHKTTLAKSYGKKGYLITLILVISFICNILALLVPFTTIGSLFSSYSCTLPYSVYLMWTESLYLIAILIAGFSIIFPFVKLLCLSHIWFIEKDTEKRNRLLRIVEPLGKWSMLDIFASCIILILCNKQILIYGRPMIGSYFFLTAIFLSIAASLTIDHLHEAKHKRQNNTTDALETNKTKSSNIWYNILILLAFILSLSILLIAIIYPYLKITSFLLIGYSYSIFTSVMALANVSLVLSAFMLLTMIIFPVLHNIFLIILWLLKLFSKKDEFPYLQQTIKVFSRLNMLDVFILGLVIFLAEGGALVEVEDRLGIVFIGAFIFMVLILPKTVSIAKKKIHSVNDD